MGRPGRSGKTEAADPLVGGGTFLVCSPRAPQSSACWGRCCGHTEVLRKHPPALSSCSLHPTGQTPCPPRPHCPKRPLHPPRQPRTSPGARGPQAVPLTAPAQRPGSLYTHTCPCTSPARQAGGRAMCLAPSSGLTPGGPQRAFLEETRPPQLGAAPSCPCWPAPSQRSTIDGPLTSPVTWALDPSTTTSGLSQVWPPRDPGQNKPAEPFHSATQPPRKSAPHPAEEQRLQAPIRRQVQGQASPTAPTSGPEELHWGRSPQGMDASDPVSPLRAPHCPGRLAESASEGYQGLFGWRHLPLHQSQGILQQEP